MAYISQRNVSPRPRPRAGTTISPRVEAPQPSPALASSGALTFRDLAKVQSLSPEVRQRYVNARTALRATGDPNDEKSQDQIKTIVSRLDDIISSNAKDDKKIEAIDKALAAPSEHKGGGWKGALMGGALDVLKTLDVPAAYARSALREGIDVVGPGDASLSQLHQQAKEHKSFKDLGLLDSLDSISGHKKLHIGLDGIRIVDTSKPGQGDSELQKKIFGFGGDVITDPLSYIHGPAEKGVKALAKEFLSPEAVNALGREGAEKAAQTALRKGASALSDEELRAVGKRAGLDFAGQHIPGSQALRPIFQGLHKVPEGLRGVKALEELPLRGARAAELRQALYHEADPSVTAAALHLDSALARQGFREGALQGEKVRTLQADLGGLSADEGRQLGRALEGASDVPAHIAEKATSVRQTLDEGLAHINELRAKLGLPEVNRLEDYFPHHMAEELIKSAGKYTGSKSNFTKFRGLKAGSEFLGETLKTGTFEEINSIAKAKGLQALFKEDAREVLPALARSMAREQAQLEKMAFLVDKGVLREGASLEGGRQAEKLGKLTDLIDRLQTRQDAKLGQYKNVTESLGRAEEDQFARNAAHQSEVADFNRAQADALRAQAGSLEAKSIPPQVEAAQAQQQLGVEAKSVAQTLLDPNAGRAPGSFLGERPDLARVRYRAFEKLDIPYSKEPLAKRLSEVASNPVSLDDHFSAVRSLLGTEDAAPMHAELAAKLRGIAERGEAKSAKAKALLDRAATKLDEAAFWDNLDVTRYELPELKNVTKLRSKAAALEADLEMLGHDVADAYDTVGLIKANPKFQQYSAQMLMDGAHQSFLESLTRVDGSDFLFGNDWAVEALQATEKYSNPAELNKLLKSFDKVTNWWKAWAVTSPGFFFRNAFGGFFNNAVAGVNPAAYFKFGAQHFGRGEGDEIYRQIVDMGILDSGQAASEVVRGLDQTGAKKAAQLVLPGSGNALTRTVRGINTEVENLLRGTMAYDMLSKGNSVEATLDAVIKFHFDYGDLTKFEKNVAKRVIPFYTFTARNLPLQLEMMARRPAMYAHYFQGAQDISSGLEPDQLIPGYFKELGAIQLTQGQPGGNEYLTPDLPFISAIEQTQKLVETARHPQQNATRLLEEANPIIKTPLELLAGKQFYSDIPIDNSRFVPVPKAWEKVPFLMAGMSLMGKTHKDPVTGEWVMTDADAYKVEQAFPLFGRFRRLFPSEDKYVERHTSSILSFLFGIGIRTNTPSSQRSLLFERGDELAAMKKELTERGIIQPPKAKAKTPPNSLRGLAEQRGL